MGACGLGAGTQAFFPQSVQGGTGAVPESHVMHSGII